MDANILSSMCSSVLGEQRTRLAAISQFFKTWTFSKKQKQEDEHTIQMNGNHILKINHKYFYYYYHHHHCRRRHHRRRDVNKDLIPKDQDNDKDLTPKDQDKDKDLTPRTRT